MASATPAAAAPPVSVQVRRLLDRLLALYDGVRELARRPLHGVATIGRLTGFAAVIATLAITFLAGGGFDFAKLQETGSSPEAMERLALVIAQFDVMRIGEAIAWIGDRIGLHLDSETLQAALKHITLALSWTFTDIVKLLETGLIGVFNGLGADLDATKLAADLGFVFGGGAGLDALKKTTDHIPAGLALLMASAWLQRRTTRT